MKRIAAWMIRLYPAAWRDRYQDEFEALLEDAGFRWRDIPNIAWSALRMRKPDLVAVALLLTCLLAGVVFTLQAPRRYLADGSVRPGSEITIAEVLNRSTLAEIIGRNHLYENAPRRMPMEDVVGLMRRDLRATRTPDGLVHLQFAYPDAELAQKVTQELLANFVQHRTVPSIAIRPIRRSLAPIGSGLAAGVLAAVMTAFLARQNRRWIGWMAASALAGASLALLIAYMIPDRYECSALVRVDDGLIQRVLADSLIRDVIASERLYPDPGSTGLERFKKNLKIERIGPDALVSFEHTDRKKAQDALRNLLGKMRQQSWEHPSGPESINLKMIDPPSLPQSPILPNRTFIVLCGLSLGLAAGALTVRRRVTLG